MVRIWLLCLAVMLAWAPGAMAPRAEAQAPIPPGALVRKDLYVHPAFDSRRDANADLNLAMEQAAQSGRNVLIDVGGNWCVACFQLDDYLARNTEVGDAFKASFVMVKVNWDPKHKNHEFLSRYPRVKGYPHFFVLDPGGKFLKNQGTAWFIRRKAYDSARFLEFAKTWGGKRE